MRGRRDTSICSIGVLDCVDGVDAGGDARSRVERERNDRTTSLGLLSMGEVPYVGSRIRLIKYAHALHSIDKGMRGRGVKLLGLFGSRMLPTLVSLVFVACLQQERDQV